MMSYSASHPEADALHALESFTYDSAGNRVADNQGSYSYDNKKYRLEEDWKYIYAFDLNGNVITKQEKNFGKTWSFSYSSENQLTAIDITEGAQVTNIDFTYDALGRRTSKTVLQNGVTTVRKFVYDNQEIIAELDGNNQILVRYTQSGLRTDDTLAMDVTSQGVSAGIAPATGTYFFLKDGLGSIIDITNSAGNLVQHYVYSSFGKLLKIENAGVDNTANPNIKTSYSYTNREYDQESGLYYYRARYYDAHSGRFLQEDPYAGTIESPSTVLSRYSYVQNNSTNAIDPSGMISFKLGSIKFSASDKSLFAFFVNPFSVVAKPFLSGKDSDRYDNLAIAASVITVAFATSPIAAGFALGGTTIQNLGRDTEGSFFDNLDDYALDFGLGFGLNLFTGVGDSFITEAASQVALRLGFDAIERSYGKGTVQGLKGVLFLSVLVPKIGVNLGSKVRQTGIGYL